MIRQIHHRNDSREELRRLKSNKIFLSYRPWKKSPRIWSKEITGQSNDCCSWSRVYLSLYYMGQERSETLLDVSQFPTVVYLPAAIFQNDWGKKKWPMVVSWQIMGHPFRNISCNPGLSGNPYGRYVIFFCEQLQKRDSIAQVVTGGRWICGSSSSYPTAVFLPFIPTWSLSRLSAAEKMFSSTNKTGIFNLKQKKKTVLVAWNVVPVVAVPLRHGER